MDMDMDMEPMEDEHEQNIDFRFSPSPQFFDGYDSDWEAEAGLSHSHGHNPPPAPVPQSSGPCISNHMYGSSEDDEDETGSDWDMGGPSTRSRFASWAQFPAVDYDSELFRLAVISGDVKLAKKIHEQKALEGIQLENKVYTKAVSAKKPGENMDDDPPGWSILMFACAAAPNLDMIKFLLELGASPNYVCSGTNLSALHALISEKTSQDKYRKSLELCLDLLVKGGMDLEKIFVENANPLVIATNYNHYFMVEYLLKKGINPNLQYSVERYVDSETTALHVAASKGNGTIVKLLLENGADVKVIDGSGLMPMDCAVVEKHMGIAELLYNIYQSGWVPGSPLPSTTLPIEEISSCSVQQNGEKLSITAAMRPGPLSCVIEKLKVENIVKQDKSKDTKEELFKFLSMTVKEAYELCGDHVGDRYKLLDGLRNYHNTRYLDSALYQLPIQDGPNLIDTGRFDSHKKVLGMRDVKSALENLDFQPGHMQTDILFLLDRIQEQTQVIQSLDSQDKDIISKHLEQILESMKECEKVYFALEDHFKKTDGNPNLEIHDLIGPYGAGFWSSNWQLILVGAFTIGGFGAMTYKYKSDAFRGALTKFLPFRY